MFIPQNVVGIDDLPTCTEILNKQNYLNKSEFRIQLIAATPGSGSDWCRTTIGLLTGSLQSVFEASYSRVSKYLYVCQCIKVGLGKLPSWQPLAALYSNLARQISHILLIDFLRFFMA